MPAVRKRKHLLARNTNQLSLGLTQTWGHVGRGVAPIGMLLVEAFYTENQWVTLGFIRSRYPALSSDTVRRRLDELACRGLIEVFEQEGRKLYRACPKVAERTIELIEEALGGIAPSHAH